VQHASRTRYKHHTKSAWQQEHDIHTTQKVQDSACKKTQHIYKVKVKTQKCGMYTSDTLTRTRVQEHRTDDPASPSKKSKTEAKNSTNQPKTSVTNIIITPNTHIQVTQCSDINPALYHSQVNRTYSNNIGQLRTTSEGYSQHGSHRNVKNQNQANTHRTRPTKHTGQC
jgi:aspartate carbamoyltransferase catalytic subunit